LRLSTEAQPVDHWSTLSNRETIAHLHLCIIRSITRFEYQ